MRFRFGLKYSAINNLSTFITALIGLWIAFISFHFIPFTDARGYFVFEWWTIPSVISIIAIDILSCVYYLYDTVESLFIIKDKE